MSAEVTVVLRWMLGVALLWVAGLPVAAALFPRFPDRGASLALPVSLSVLGLVVFWVGQVRYGYVAPLAAAVVVLLAGLVAATRAERPGEFRAYFRPALEPAVVFAATFGLVLAVRLVDPAVVPWGGEKFLDYGLVRAVLRAGALPPEDIWFAGKPVRYYYLGHVVVATLGRLTATPPRFAYNLALATLFGTLATAVYGVAGAVAAPRRRLGGALGVLFAVLGGHLATPARAVVGALGRDAALALTPVWTGIRASRADALETIGRITEPYYGYWPARHVIPDVPTAFPMWTFVNGDLRAHMLAAPFVVLAAAVAFAYYRTPADRLDRRRALALGVLPAVAGLLAATNTWSAPVALGLGWLALAHAPAPPRSLLGIGSPGEAAGTATGPLPDGGAGGIRPRVRLPSGGVAGALVEEARRVAAATVVTALAGLLAVAVAAPFLLGPRPANEGVALVSDHSDAPVLWLAYGGFVAAFLLAGLAVARPRVDARVALVPVAGAVGLALLGTDLAVGVLVAPLGVAGWYYLRRARRAGDHDPGPGFVALLAVAGAGLLVAGELVYARVWPYDPNAPRWNTMYKLSTDLWLVWGIGAGAALARADRRASDVALSVPRIGTPTVPGIGPGIRVTRRRVFRILAALLVVAVAAFPALALGAHFGAESHPGPSPSLDAHAWANDSRGAEMRAIRWLDRREGTPTVLTHPGRHMYQWENAPSTFAGLPTVLGWYHEAGYRGEAAYRERREDVRRIYEGDPSTARRLLERYDVRYVYLGPPERAAYGYTELGEIPGLTKVYDTFHVEIYRVDPVANATGADATAGTPTGGNGTDGEDGPDLPTAHPGPPGGSGPFARIPVGPDDSVSIPDRTQ